MTFAGCVLVTGLTGGSSIGAAGILVGLASAFGYALYSIFTTYALKNITVSPSLSTPLCWRLWARCR